MADPETSNWKFDASKRCYRIAPYCFVFLLNSAAAILLFPTDNDDGGKNRRWFSKDDGGVYVSECPLLDKISFLGLMMASLGAGWTAAFLWNRAGASDHAKLVTGYALVNWAQSFFGSLLLIHRTDLCIYGPIRSPENRTAAFVFRFCLYVTALLWMQLLIVWRVEQLEDTSKLKYRSQCLRGILGVQWLGATFAFTSVFLIDIERQDMYVDWGHMIEALCKIVTCLMWCLSILGSVVAMSSLCQFFRDLREVSRSAALSVTTNSGRHCLRRSVRFAGRQVIGLSVSLVLTTCVVPAALAQVGEVLPSCHGDPDEACTNEPKQFQGYQSLDWLCILVQGLDILGNAAAAVLVSGCYRLSRTPTLCSKCLAKNDGNAKPLEPSSTWSPAWRAKVEELSMRGMTLNSLLLFHHGLTSMEDWTYVPECHKTRDVVRRAIIPMTSSEGCAYAVSRLNWNGARRAQVMVTHNWGNNFKDLFAAVVSDALGECSFEMAGHLMDQDQDLHFLWTFLAKSKALETTYWICAFAVNQHISICHSNPYDHDPLTNQLHPVCHCVHRNISDPEGTSAESEINKFDDMMYHLATTEGCRQVIAVDQSLDLFHRAWCVAEIAEAKRLHMNQSLKLVSSAVLQRRANTLQKLDIRDMGASSAKDKELILGRIENVDDFNAQLQSLIFDSQSGLLATWRVMDSLQQIGEVGRLIRWGVADGGTGKVWKAWDLAMAPPPTEATEA